MKLKRRKTIKRYYFDALLVIFGALLLALLPNAISFAYANDPVWPIPPGDVVVIEKQVPVEKEVRAPIGCDSEKCRIYAYLVEKFQDDAANAITMLRKCENSKFNQQATNLNKNGTTDYGVMQINSIHIPKCGEGIITSWKSNIDCGHKIYKASGNTFHAWSCAGIINQSSYKDSL